MGDETPMEPVWGTPEPESPGHQPPSGGRAGLLSTDAFAVIERSGFMTGRSYELVAMDGVSLGQLSEQTSAGNWLFGNVAASTFVLQDAAGRLLATMTRPGSMGRFHFVVTDGQNQDAGRVEQENAFFAPQFELRASDGTILRLTGGSLGSTDWELLNTQDDAVVGRVYQEFSGISGILGGTQRFAVRLSPVLDGPARLLAVMVSACLDYVRDAKKRR